MAVTYVEEKSLFWKRKNGIEENVSTRTVPTAATAATPSSLSFTPPLDIPQQQHLAAMVGTQAAPLVEQELVRSNSVPDLCSLLVEAEADLFEHDLNSIHFDHRNSLLTAMMMHDVVVVPKMTMRVHRHLADQHFFGSPSVNDGKGAMTAGEIHCIHIILGHSTFCLISNSPSPIVVFDFRCHEHECRFLSSDLGRSQMRHGHL
jgi:hypothetical protein